MIKIKQMCGRKTIEREYDSDLRTYRWYKVSRPYYKLTAEQEKWKFTSTILAFAECMSIRLYSSKSGKVLITAEHDRNLKSGAEVLNYVIFKNKIQFNKFKFKAFLNKKQDNLKFDAYCNLVNATFVNRETVKNLNYIESYSYAA